MVLLKERINTWLKPPVPYFTIMFLFAPWVMHFSQLVIQLIACHHLFFTSRFPTLSCISIKSLPCSSHCLWLHYKVNSTKSLKCIFLGYSPPPLKGLSLFLSSTSPIYCFYCHFLFWDLSFLLFHCTWCPPSRQIANPLHISLVVSALIIAFALPPLLTYQQQMQISTTVPSTNHLASYSNRPSNYITYTWTSPCTHVNIGHSILSWMLKIQTYKVMWIF